MQAGNAVITGAGGALAGHLIEACAARSWKLALVAHGDGSAARLRSTWPDACVVQADLADPAAAQTALAAADAALGGVDRLFNIAGGFAMGSTIDSRPPDLEHQLDINFRSAWNATRAVLPGMLARGRGFVLGVGAAAALHGGARTGAYAAAKAALVAWLKSLRAETAAGGINVGILYPMGAIDTPGNRQAMPDTDPEAWIDPAELVAAMLFLADRSPRGRVAEIQVHPRP